MPKSPRRWGQTGQPRRKIRDRQRKTATQRGYNSVWSRYSRGRLERFPECEECGDPGDVTDHIKPVTGPDDPLFWDEQNHQTLCYSCHGQKTAAEVNGADIGRDNYHRGE